MYHVSLVVMACFYIYAGISHFRIPRFFLSITPPWVPYPEKVNVIIGVLEIALGALVLVPASRSIAAIGLIVLLVIVFPANVYHLQKALKKKKKVWLTVIRLPIQALLIYWAYSFI